MLVREESAERSVKKRGTDSVGRNMNEMQTGPKVESSLTLGCEAQKWIPPQDNSAAALGPGFANMRGMRMMTRGETLVKMTWRSPADSEPDLKLQTVQEDVLVVLFWLDQRPRTVAHLQLPALQVTIPMMRTTGQTRGRARNFAARVRD